MRDDFNAKVKRIVADRVNGRCSRCNAQTSGPQADATKSLNVGVAAHITAASGGGPRFDPDLTSSERSHPDNAIWLCQTCGKLIDDDPVQFPAVALLQMKADAEKQALTIIGRSVESGNGTVQTSTGLPSDFDALKEYSAQFDRPALQDELHRCGSFVNFRTALDELIEVLNAGTKRAKPVTKRRADFANSDWRAQLGEVYEAVRELRAMYVDLVKAGEIDEKQCTCNFRKRSCYFVFEKKKHEAVCTMNKILMAAGLPTIRGVY